MSRAICLVIAASFGTGVALEAQQRATTSKPQAPRVTTTAVCASDQGTGVKSRRRFCDVVVASTARESVSMTIPPHAGAATLAFDLHNRFTLPPDATDLTQAFTRHTALVAVIRPTGDVIDRAAVSREYRSPSDLFDRIAAARGAAPKNIAPGHPQGVRVTIPAGVNVIGIVGTRLEEWRATGWGAFATPDRPIAFVSNLRVEYTPR